MVRYGEMKQQLQCPNCGNQITQANFCGYCGTRLISTTQLQQNKHQQPERRHKTDTWLNIIVIIAIIIFVVGLAFFIYSSISKTDSISSSISPHLAKSIEPTMPLITY